MEFITGSPVIIPRSMILKHNAGENLLYLKAIRHEKLNRPDKPCEPSPEYKLASCLEKSVVARAGCQPPWKRFTVDGQPTCDNVSLSIWRRVPTPATNLRYASASIEFLK